MKRLKLNSQNEQLVLNNSDIILCQLGVINI